MSKESRVQIEALLRHRYGTVDKRLDALEKLFDSIAASYVGKGSVIDEYLIVPEYPESVKMVLRSIKRMEDLKISTILNGLHEF